MSQQNGIVEYFKRLEHQHFLELISYVRALEKDYGSDCMEVLASAKYELTYQQWAELARSQEQNGIAKLFELLWEGAGPLLEYEVLYRDSEEIRLRVTKCFWADTFREMGAAGIGKTLYCDDEHASASGFNPRIRLTRSKTLMEGDDCCDHCYLLEE